MLPQGTYRELMNIEKYKSKVGKSRARAIRAKCVDCSGGVLAEVRRCAITDCPLWHFRMGKWEDIDGN